MKGARRKIFCLLVVLIFAFDAYAAEKLEVSLISLGLRSRNEAPIPVEARFKWDSTRLLEGRLVMEFREGNRLLGRYRSGELALAGGDQNFRMLLPPALAPYSDSQIEVKMRFVTAGSAIELDSSFLSAPTSRERSLVVGWCNLESVSDDSSSDFVRSLMLERYAPVDDNSSRRLLTTSVARFAPVDLPAQPLGFTKYDIVVLSADAFKEAGERQLQSLARWVKGGGSVCVFMGGGLEKRHLEFLNQLAESTPDDSKFLSDGAGNILPRLQKILRLHSGVGRTVIVPALNGTINDSDWRTAATFLWKVRSQQARTIIDAGHWNTFTNVQTQYNPSMTYYEPMFYGVLHSQSGGELLRHLMPQTVRLIPFSALLILLALFLAMIGPVDYYILGIFRRRKYTWILFPLTSIAFTVVTVLMANHYLGLRDQRRSLVIVDMAGDGTALRWNRYELVFAARDKQSVTELKDALWSPMNVGLISDNPYYNPYNRGYRSYRGGDNDSSPPLYDGVLPVHFQTTRMLHQWQPVLNRVLSFEPPPVPLPSNWRSIEEAWPDLDSVRAKLSEKKNFIGDIYIFSGINSNQASSDSVGIFPIELLGQLCRGESLGWLSVVSQISPTGGGNFEDIAALDPDTNDSVLAIVTRIGDDVVVYRRFFYGN